MFDNLPALAAPKPSDLWGELERFLSTDPEHVKDTLAWWYEHQHVYPQLSRMARDYLTIPGKYKIVIGIFE
jgi:hAT family C-terminal dimerisation region